jgi:hypothetical protein
VVFSELASRVVEGRRVEHGVRRMRRRRVRVWLPGRVDPGTQPRRCHQRAHHPRRRRKVSDDDLWCSATDILTSHCNSTAPLLRRHPARWSQGAVRC